MSGFCIKELIEDYGIITIHGTSEIYIQNYVSIFEINTNIIKIKTLSGMICIEGNELVIEYMNEIGIKVNGQISKIEMSGM